MKSEFKRFFAPALEYKAVSFFQLLIGILWGLYNVILLIYIYFITKNLELKNHDVLYDIIIYFTVIVFVYYILLLSLSKRGWVESFDSYNKELDKVYFKKLFKLNPSYIEKYGTGKIIDIVNSGIDTWAISLSQSLEIIPKIIIGVLVTVYFLNAQNLYYVFIYIFIYIFFIFLGKYINNILLKFRKKRRENRTLRSKQSVKCIMSKSEILYSDKIDKEIGLLNYFVDKQTYWNKKMGTYMFVLFEAPRFTMYLFIFALSYYLFGLHRQGLISLTDITVTITAITVSINSITVGIDFYKNFTKEYIDIDKLNEFFDNGEYLDLNEKSPNYIHKTGELSLKNISFGYGKDKIFDNFYLDVSGGKVTALVGPSGGGKSTLVKIISANLEINSGDIFIDDQSYNSINKKSLYKSIGYLSQEPAVFDGSVLDNLLYSNSELHKDSKLLKEAIKNASSNFLYELPNGLDTEIGERGVRLSGGQKQRLAIAKLFLKDPDIIILDEPTSALDSMSEDLITKSLHKLFKNRTVIIIAHRLQTVKSADKILFIQDGKVIEDGTHSELVKQNGQYKQMLDLQTGF